MSWNFGNLRRNAISMRTSKGDTVRVASNGIGITEKTLDDIENGRRYPSIRNLIEMARYYGVTPDELMGGWE